jgi:hypothetical protein
MAYSLTSRFWRIFEFWPEKTNLQCRYKSAIFQYIFLGRFNGWARVEGDDISGRDLGIMINLTRCDKSNESNAQVNMCSFKLPFLPVHSIFSQMHANANPNPGQFLMSYSNGFAGSSPKFTTR